jgi:hypothetical protein
MRVNAENTRRAGARLQTLSTRKPGDGVPLALRRRFAHFRDTNAARIRVPDDLRQAVLSALGEGVSMLAVRRDLELTAKQVESWRRYVATTPVEVEPVVETEKARVFAVADRRAVGECATASGDSGEALELRLGAWSVVIRSTCP